MSLSDVIETALEKMRYIARTETVIGEPITAGAVTLIPVSKISIGFAAGGSGEEGKKGSGSGTGGGINVEPLAFIVITGEKVSIQPVSSADSDLKRLLRDAPDVMKKVYDFIKGRNKGTQSRSASDDKETHEKNDTGTQESQETET
jgi:uncharacterized spore protein YtfJ